MRIMCLCWTLNVKESFHNFLCDGPPCDCPHGQLFPIRKRHIAMTTHHCWVNERFVPSMGIRQLFVVYKRLSKLEDILIKNDPEYLSIKLTVWMKAKILANPSVLHQLHQAQRLELLSENPMGLPPLSMDDLRNLYRSLYSSSNAPHALRIKYKYRRMRNKKKRSFPKTLRTVVML